MNIRILALCTLVSCFSIVAMNEDITLPSASELEEVFNNLHLGHLAKQTGVIQKLADIKKPALGVLSAINVAFLDYLSLPEITPAAAAATKMRKETLIRRLLEKYPNAVRELEAEGCIKKISK